MADAIEIFNPALFAAILLAYLMPKLSPYIDKALSFLKQLLVRTLPSKLKGYVRKRRLKRLRKLKEDRRNIAAINYQISKANSAFNLFVGVFFMYVLLVGLGLFNASLSINLRFVVLTTWPIFLCEILWLIQDSKAKELVVHAGNVRVTNRR